MIVADILFSNSAFQQWHKIACEAYSNFFIQRTGLQAKTVIQRTGVYALHAENINSIPSTTWSSSGDIQSHWT